MEIAVLDLGQTIRSHLTKHPNYSGIASDVDAVLQATKEGVSGTPPGSLNRLGEPNSGVGLFELRSYCETGGGDLTIVSGNAMLTFRAGEEPMIQHFAGGFPGCLVNAQFLVW